MNDEEKASQNALKLTSQTFELITFMEVADLVRELSGASTSGKKLLNTSLIISCIDFKVKHLNLLKSADTWKALLYENSEKLPLLQNTKNFLRATLEHFLGDYDCFLFVQKSQINTIIERIVSLFEPGYIRKSYDELLDFGTPTEGIQPEVIKAQNNFLFRYLIGWMGLFFHFSTEAAELKYYDSNSVKVHNPLVEKEETSNYLSNLVYNPTLNQIQSYSERFGLLKMTCGRRLGKTAKSCVGPKVFKRLDIETKLMLVQYFENLNTVAREKITNELPQSSRNILGLTEFCCSIIIEGTSSDLFPKENILSCSEKIHGCFRNLYNPKLDTHIFETLNPCYDPVPVPFIERLNELGFSMDFQRAVFYNTMYFFKIFSLQVIGVYRNFVIKDDSVRHFENKHSVTAKNIELINRKAKLKHMRKFESTDDEEGSIVKNTTSETPRENHPNLIYEREEPIVRKSNLMSMKYGIQKKQEVAEGEDEISICSPAKKAHICVTLDSDSDEDS